MRARAATVPFFWAVGIENTVNPALGWDQYTWTAHRERWADDLRLAAEVGVTHVRYGVPWPDVNPAPDTYDWTWPDQAVALLRDLGLEPIWDLLHFGTPPWLPGGLRDPGYPAAVTAYARAFSERYPQVTKITPFNEPYIWAFFSGGNGTWPPHELGVQGFARSLWPVLAGLRGAIQAIREVNPHAEIWLNDGADRFRATTPALTALAGELTEWRYAAFDVLCGRLERNTPLYAALAGVAGADVLEAALNDPTPPDVIGLDYYPGSEHAILPPHAPPHPGDWGRRPDYRLYPDPQPPGLAHTLLEYHARYGLPLYVAETSTDTRREDWLRWLGSEVLHAQERGAAVLGATWWPLFDHVDWHIGLTRLEGHVCPSGLYHLNPDRHDRQPDPALPFFRDFIQNPLMPADVSAPVPQDALNVTGAASPLEPLSGLQLQPHDV
ncbi:MULTISPECIES: family 1 glycosylhydrolase [Deinococcus]|uniref:Family 1 glycosylhydrolase n=1 Tax=Deinococcus rufus TaxID=2136097 RepID=A0ABV7Z224_9DEIO|nr:family 1 glycosylhydrolase [Deinococcus sp. AB2017081]WQE95286.1 family 1 glycosylhydrolase [Deinococcus sp. AB2017081]